MSVLTLLFWLAVGHALCDYPLQGDFLARAKNHRLPVPGVPSYQALGAHAAIHAGMVALITGSVTLGLLEYIAHVAIDWAKCEGLFGFNTDQLLHGLCKLAWALLAVTALR